MGSIVAVSSSLLCYNLPKVTPDYFLMLFLKVSSSRNDYEKVESSLISFSTDFEGGDKDFQA